MKQEHIEELASSWINGNKGYVRQKVKRMRKIDFFHLIEHISKFNPARGDRELIAMSLTD